MLTNRALDKSAVPEITKQNFYEILEGRKWCPKLLMQQLSKQFEGNCDGLDQFLSDCKPGSEYNETGYHLLAWYAPEVLLSLLGYLAENGMTLDQLNRILCLEFVDAFDHKQKKLVHVLAERPFKASLIKVIKLVKKLCPDPKKVSKELKGILGAEAEGDSNVFHYLAMGCSDALTDVVEYLLKDPVLKFSYEDIWGFLELQEFQGNTVFYYLANKNDSNGSNAAELLPLLQLFCDKSSSCTIQKIWQLVYNGHILHQVARGNPSELCKLLGWFLDNSIAINDVLEAMSVCSDDDYTAFDELAEIETSDELAGVANLLLNKGASEASVWNCLVKQCNVRGSNGREITTPLNGLKYVSPNVALQLLLRFIDSRSIPLKVDQFELAASELPALGAAIDMVREEYAQEDLAKKGTEIIFAPEYRGVFVNILAAEMAQLDSFFDKLISSGCSADRIVDALLVSNGVAIGSGLLALLCVQSHQHFIPLLNKLFASTNAVQKLSEALCHLGWSRTALNDLLETKAGDINFADNAVSIVLWGSEKTVNSKSVYRPVGGGVVSRFSRDMEVADTYVKSYGGCKRKLEFFADANDSGGSDKKRRNHRDLKAEQSKEVKSICQLGGAF